MNENIPYDLLAKYLASECNAEEKKQAESWLEQSPQNKKVLLELKQIWQSETSAFNPDVENALKKVHAKLDDNKSANIFSITPYLRVAAVVLITAGLFLIGRNILTGEQLITETNNSDQPKEIVLPDGTKIWLNKATSLEYAKNFDKQERHVKLSGEAYFDVARNPEKPFIIKTELSEIKVLGTEFNVKAIPTDTIIRVSVTEGLVAFKSNSFNEEVKLTAGETGTFHVKEKLLEKQLTANPNYMSWKSGKLKLIDIPLKTAVKEISEFYNIDIVIADSALYEESLNVTFLKDKPDMIVFALQSMGKVEINSDGTVIISIE